MNDSVHPLLTLNLITYNRAAKLNLTLTAIAASRLRDFPLTIFDNHSSDETPDVCASFINKIPKLRVVRHGINIGGIGNFLTALSNVNGIYSWILCDDDAIDIEAVNQMIADLVLKEPDLIVSPHRRESAGISSQLISFENWLASTDSVYFNCSFIPAVIFRTKLLAPKAIADLILLMPYYYPQLAYIESFRAAGAKVWIPRTNFIERNDPGDMGFSHTLFHYGWLKCIGVINSPVLRLRAWREMFRRGGNSWLKMGKCIGAWHALRSDSRLEIAATVLCLPWVVRLPNLPWLILLIVPRNWMRGLVNRFAQRRGQVSFTEARL